MKRKAMKIIKKISKDRVGAFLGIDLLPNKIVIGWDVSMRSTGIAIIRTTDTYLMVDKLHKITIPKKVNSIDALDLFINQLNEFAMEVSKTYKIDINIIEDCFLKKNVNTLKALARHSVLVYGKFKGLARKQIFILPTSARNKVRFKKSHKKIKGHALKKELVEFINNALDMKLKAKDNDLSDAILLALAGLRYE